MRSDADVKWLITDHAVERYRQRVAPGLDYEQAVRRVISVLGRAHKVRDCDGFELWRSSRPDRLRIRAVRNGDRLEVKTILFAFDR